jgi:hypothetical protein
MLCGNGCAGKPLVRAKSGELECPNNAYLNAVDTYYGYLPQFEMILAEERYEFGPFYERVMNLAQLGIDERRAILDAMVTRTDSSGAVTPLTEVGANKLSSP